MSAFNDTQDEDTMRSKNALKPIPTDSIMDITSKEEDNQISLNNISCVHTTSVKLTLSVYGNDLRVKHPFKMGNVYSFLFLNGDPKIVVGPQYYMSIILFLIVNIINWLLICFVYQGLNSIFRVIGVIIYTLQITSQVLCSIVNPGIPHRNNYVSDGVMHSIYQQVKYNNYKFDKYRVCKICNIIVTVDQDITHCEDCNICVENLDHHCVWIGKCIAKRNLRIFNIFVISTAAFGVFSIISLVALVIANVARSL